MIKSLNIPRTDQIVFATVINTLQDTSELHKQLEDKLGVDQGYRQRRADIRKNIKELEVQLDTVETSLADLETDVRTNKIDTAIFERVKTNLACQREDLLEKIEQASIRYERLDHDVQWLSALSNLTLDTARFEKNFSDRKKKDWLSRIIERIDVNYLHDTQEHEVNLRLKIPLFSDASLGIKTYKTGDFIHRCPRTVHSTVVGLPSFGVVSGENCTNTFVKATIKVRSSGCWVSTYTDYQQFLSDKIISCRNSGWTFKRIADWFNTNGFQTPRNKTFSDRHVHGILKKRLARDERFFAEPEVTIVDSSLHYE